MENELKQKIRSEALSFMKTHKVAVLSTSVENEPHSAVIYYSVDDDFVIHFVTDPSSKKGQNIKNNKKVSIVIGAGPEISTMQGGGEVEEEPSRIQQTIEEISSKLTSRESHHWPLNKLQHETLMCYKVKLTWLTWLNMDLTGTSANVYKEGFHQVIP